MPEGAEEGILRGLHRVRAAPRARRSCACSAPATILREVEAAAEILADDFEIEAEVWSVTSFTELRRDGLRCARHERLHPGEDAPTAVDQRVPRPARAPRSSPPPTT